MSQKDKTNITSGITSGFATCTRCVGHQSELTMYVKYVLYHGTLEIKMEPSLKAVSSSNFTAKRMAAGTEAKQNLQQALAQAELHLYGRKYRKRTPSGTQ